MSIVVRHEAVDVLDQVSDASEGASPNGFLSNDVEPDFNLVQPGGVGWGVVDMISWSGVQPSFYPVVFVGRVIVYDQVDVQVHRDAVVNEA